MPVLIHIRGGHVEPLAGEPQVDLERGTITADSREVGFNDVKGLFYVRAEGEAETELPSGSGWALTVEFQDGERIRGTSFDYSPDRSAFTLYPADRTRNDRILVVTAAVTSIDIE